MPSTHEELLLVLREQFLGNHHHNNNSSPWKLEWNVQLFTILYCGIVNSALLYYLRTWCISKKGPVFAAMFSPLLLVIVGIFSSFVFAERLHLSSLIGALIIILGLYCVLWGKSKDNYMRGKSPSQKPSLDDHQTIVD